MTIHPTNSGEATSVTLAEAKARFSELVRRAEAGERIIVTRHGKPVAELSSATRDKRPSIVGMFEGQGWMADDFDELGPEWDEYIS